MDPITLAIAAALAAGVATGAGESAGSALATLAGRLRRRFADRPEALASQEATAEALTLEFESDPEFARECRALWRRAEHEHAVNSFHGQAGTVIQAGQVNGGITLS